jgi:RTX calcium-binding nonapeptide repeat (4 copies)
LAVTGPPAAWRQKLGALEVRAGEADEADTIDADVEDLRGGTGADQLTGAPGNDRLVGEADDDHLDAVDGPGFVDSLICGDGAADTALADAEDDVGADCEG